MYKFQAVNRVDKENSFKDPGIKDHIIQNMLTDFSHEIFKTKCFEITETDLEYGKQEIVIETFIMTPQEFKKSIELFNLIKLYTDIPETLRDHIIQLHSIITKVPLK